MATDISWHEVCGIQPEPTFRLVIAHALSINLTNKERQQARFERDRKKRLEKRLQKEKELCNYDKAISVDELIKAFYECKKGVSWKKSVQNYEMQLFQNVSELHRKLANCKNVSRGYVQFYIWERGKKRKIQACHISERVVQKSIANNILTPMLESTLIKNNCASQKGKGTHQAWDYFEQDLKKAYKKWGRDFYVIQSDFHNYFASIPHDKLIAALNEYFHDERTRWYYKSVINSFYENGECIGLGLGSQICQNFAIFYPNLLDHYMEQFGDYGRFNDDLYLTVQTKEEAKQILNSMYRIVDSLGLEINKKKTRIVKATHVITFLKTRFNLLDNGEVIRRPNHKSITRERKKLKKLKKKLDDGVLSFEDVRTSYASWRGSLKDKKCYKTLKSMDDLFNKLFIEDWRLDYES